MLQFRKITTFKAIEKDKAYDVLSGIPSVIVDGLINRFTETARDSSRLVVVSPLMVALTHTFSKVIKQLHL